MTQRSRTISSSQFAAAVENQVIEKLKSIIPSITSLSRSVAAEIKSMHVDSLKAKSLAEKGCDLLNNNSNSAGANYYSEAASDKRQKAQNRKKNQPFMVLTRKLR